MCITTKLNWHYLTILIIRLGKPTVVKWLLTMHDRTMMVVSRKVEHDLEFQTHTREARGIWVPQWVSISFSLRVLFRNNASMLSEKKEGKPRHVVRVEKAGAHYTDKEMWCTYLHGDDAHRRESMTKEWSRMWVFSFVPGHILYGCCFYRCLLWLIALNRDWYK